MHTSIILQEAIRLFFDDETLELSIVLFAIAVERLMRQPLFETDEVLISPHHRISCMVQIKANKKCKMKKNQKKQFLIC